MAFDEEYSVGLDNDQFMRAAKGMQRQVEGINKKMSRMGTVAKAAAGVAAAAYGAVKLGGLAKDAVAVAANYEQMKVALESVTGSAAEAEAVFLKLREFSDKTPFEPQELIEAFTKLTAYGLNPSIEALESYGNTASALGKSLDQMVEAVADAAVGEFERLKEFGIKAKSEGENVSFTFRGITTTVGKNAEEIEAYLRSIGQTQFAGAIEKQSKTLNGLMSTLSGSFKNSVNDIVVNSGAFDDVKEGIAQLIPVVKELGENEDVQKFAAGLATVFVASIKGAVAAIELLAVGFNTATEGVTNLLQWLDDVGVFDAIVVAINAVIEVVQAMADAFESAMATVNAAIEGVSDAVDAVGGFVDGVGDKLGGLGESAAAAGKSYYDGLMNWLWKTEEDAISNSPVPDLVNGVEHFLKMLPEHANKYGTQYYDEIMAALEKANVDAQTMMDVGSALRQGQTNIGRAEAAEMKELAAAAEEAATADKKLTKELDTLMRRLYPARAAAKDFAREQEVLNDAFNSGKIDIADYHTAMEDLQSEYDKSIEKGEDLKDNLYTVQDAAEELQDTFKNMGDGLSKTLREGGDLGDFFANKLTSAFDRISDSFFNSAFDQIGGSLFGGGGGGGGMGGMLGGLFGGGGGGGGLFSSIGSIFGFNQEGKVPGPVGQPRLVMAHGGETQFTRDTGHLKGETGITVGTLNNVFNVEMDDKTFEDMWRNAAAKNVRFLEGLRQEQASYGV